MKQAFNRMKYKTKLSLAMICIVTIPILLFMAFYLKSTVEQRQKDQLLSYDDDLRKSVYGIKELMNITIQKFNSLDHNAQLQMFLKYPRNVDLAGKIDLFYNLNSLYLALCISSEMKDMKIYAKNLADESLSFVVSFDNLDEGVRQAVSSRQGNSLLIVYNGTEEDRRSGQGDLSLYKTNLGLDGKIVAVQQIVLSFANFNKLFEFSKLPPGSILLYAVPGQSPIVISGGQANAGAVDACFDEYLSGHKSGAYEILQYDLGYRTADLPPATNLGRAAQADDCLLAFIPLKPMRTESMKFILAGAGVALLAVLFVIFVISTVSKALTNRLYYLIGSINTEIGELEKRDKAAVIGGDDEFKQINASFHELIGKIKESYRNNACMESEKRLLEAELLQDLINPHFLYNTLESIKWTARDKQVTGIIDSMVKYYRIALNNGDSMLPVRQELKLVEEYVKLQRFAFESDFRYSFECYDEAAECLMLKHLVQPVVENAILHGIDKQGSKGNIAVTCRLANGMLEITVEDNGAGIGEEKLAGLRAGLGKGTGGFGLGCVRKRLALHYGREASISNESKEGAGTIVVIRIPCCTAKVLCS